MVWVRVVFACMRGSAWLQEPTRLSAREAQRTALVPNSPIVAMTPVRLIPMGAQFAPDQGRAHRRFLAHGRPLVGRRPRAPGGGRVSTMPIADTTNSADRCCLRAQLERRHGGWRGSRSCYPAPTPKTAEGARFGSSGSTTERTPLIERMLNPGSSLWSSAKKPRKCAAP